MTKLAATATAAALVLSACGGGGSAEDENALRVGVMLSQTGAAAPFGVPEKEAIETVTQSINDDGGVNGHDVELFIRDDMTDPTEASRIARELILDNNVDVIIGATIGSATLAAAPIAASNEVPMVAPNGTIAITDPENDFSDWIFRSSINDAVNAESAVTLAKDAGGPKLGVFFQEDAYGETSHQVVERMSDEDPELEIVSTATAPLAATDVAAQATRLVNADPDAILVQVSAPALGGAVVRALDQVRYDGLVIVAGGLTSDAFIQASGGAAEGVEATGGLGMDAPTEGQQAFLDVLEEYGYGPPTGFAEFIGAGALNAVVAAAETIDGEITGAKMRDALSETCFESLHQGPEVCYSDGNHDGFTTENSARIRVEDGQWVTAGG